MSQALDEIKIGGLGASRKRVEDNRFIRGKGNYVDDIVLPGMLHMEILRSPLAHARIRSIDTSKAWDIPGVRLVLTGEMMASRNLAWMPTLSYDTQAVLATDKVRFQGQEVACVIADDPYIAKDACEAIVVDYEPLPVIVNPTQALADGAPLIRDDKENQHDNVVYDWEVGDKAGTDRAFEQADVVSKLELHYPRSHPSPLECCGSIADFNRSTSKLTVYMTTQAPHIIRAAVALVAELPEHMIRIVSPDLGGGFGNKVPVYPGYVMSILASILLERPVKWIEDKTGNLISTGFARDIYLHGRDGAAQGRQDPRRPHAHRRRPRRVLLRRPAEQVQDRADALGVRLLRHPRRAPDRAAACTPTRRRAASRTGARSGSPRRCTSRSGWCRPRPTTSAWTRPSSGACNFVRDDDFPHRTPFGFLTDSGQYGKCLDVGLEAIGYQDFLRQKEEAKKQGRLLGIGISTMTEPLGAGNSREYDILGIKMFDSAELRVHMTGKAILRTGAKTQGQGHETTWAQIVAHELGIPAEDVDGRGGRHRHRAVRHGHVRLAQHAGRRRRGGDGVAQGPGQGPQARRAPARGVRGGHRVGARSLLRAQRAGPRRHHPGVRDGRVQQHARRHGAGPGEQRLLRPAQPHVAVRAATSRPSRSTRRPACGTCSTWSRSTTAACASTR